MGKINWNDLFFTDISAGKARAKEMNCHYTVTPSWVTLDACWWPDGSLKYNIFSEDSADYDLIPKGMYWANCVGSTVDYKKRPDLPNAVRKKF